MSRPADPSGSGEPMQEPVYGACICGHSAEEHGGFGECEECDCAGYEAEVEDDGYDARFDDDPRF